MATLLSLWAPPLDRSKMSTFVYAGNELRPTVNIRLHLPLIFYSTHVVYALCFYEQCLLVVSDQLARCESHSNII